MKLLATLLLPFSLLSASCKKHDAAAKISADRFIFGDAYGMCRENCVHLFLYQDGKLYADSMQTLAPLQFSKVPLSDAAADKARALLESFPAELITAETEKTIGCPDCHDQGTYYIEYRQADGKPHTLRVDTDEKEQPAGAKDWLKKMAAVIGELR